MKKESRLLPYSTVAGTGTGLLLMAFFTLVWSGIAYYGLSHSHLCWTLVIFPLFAILFVYNAITLFQIPNHQPEQTSASSDKKRRKWFWIIFALEGLGILVAINIVVNLGYPQLQLPAIALVVGLHFFPFAKMFNRRIDYYLATFSTGVAVTAIVLTLQHTLSGLFIFAFTGIGMATITTCYGIYMLLLTRKLH